MFFSSAVMLSLVLRLPVVSFCSYFALLGQLALDLFIPVVHFCHETHIFRQHHHLHLLCLRTPLITCGCSEGSGFSLSIENFSRWGPGKYCLCFQGPISSPLRVLWPPLTWCVLRDSLHPLALPFDSHPKDGDAGECHQPLSWVEASLRWVMANAWRFHTLPSFPLLIVWRPLSGVGTLGIHFAHPSVVPGLELIEGRDCETWSCLLVTIRTSESMGQPMRCVRSEPCLSSVPALEECILASVIWKGFVEELGFQRGHRGQSILHKTMFLDVLSKEHIQAHQSWMFSFSLHVTCCSCFCAHVHPRTEGISRWGGPLLTKIPLLGCFSNGPRPASHLGVLVNTQVVIV